MLNSSNMAGFFTKSISQIIGSSYYNKPTVTSPYILGTSPPDGSMELYILDSKLQVCSCPRENIKLFCHAIIKVALLQDSRPNFFSITETDNQYTLILTEEDFKELPENNQLETSGQLWRVLTVSVGALGSFNEVLGVSKIAKSAIGPLADHNISVLCLSTYQSDYILVQESQIDDAIRCLSSYFKIFNEDHKRVNDTRTMSPASPLPRKSRPIIHPYKSPNEVYHITGLDASKLSDVTQILLELLFYPRQQEDDEEMFSFFHFTIVHGDISLVLDNESFKKFPKNALYTAHSTKADKWKIISIGDQPLGFVECGIVAQVVEPLATSQVSSYYLSTYDIEYCMVHEKDYKKVVDTFEKLKLENYTDTPVPASPKLTPHGIVIASPDGGNELGGGGANKTETETKNEGEPVEEMRPGENMSLGETLDTIEGDVPTVPYHMSDTGYSRSPLTPTSECSSYGTSPQSDPELPPLNVSASTSVDTNTTDPIPIPPNCLRDSLTRLKC